MFARGIAFAILGIGLTSGVAQATEMVAGHLDFSYSSLTEDSDSRRLGFAVGAEYGLATNVNVQFNSGVNVFDASNDLQGDISVHGIYSPLEFVAVGAFIGYEGYDGYDTLFAGVEGKFDFGRGSTEGYYQIANAQSTEFRSWGVSAHVDVAPGVGIGAFFDDVELPGARDFNRYGIGAEYRYSNKFGIFANVGTTESAGSGGANATRSPFVEIGARYLLGGNGQTTFGKRSAFGILPGS